MIESYISRREFCDRFNIHPQTARRWELAKKLTPIAVSGGCTRYSVSEVERLIDDAKFCTRKRPGPKPRPRGTSPSAQVAA